MPAPLRQAVKDKDKNKHKHQNEDKRKHKWEADMLSSSQSSLQDCIIVIIITSLYHHVNPVAAGSDFLMGRKNHPQAFKRGRFCMQMRTGQLSTI